MASSNEEDAFSQFESLLCEAGNMRSPWSDQGYKANIELLRRLLTLPIRKGDKQESGRTAKALDSWIAQELRRSGFVLNSVWPRLRRPRVLPEGLDVLEESLDELKEQLEKFDTENPRILARTDLRKAIKKVLDVRVGAHEAYILGDFYAKQIDVGMSSWRRGPELLISTKTMFSKYKNNLKTRHEEAVGEVSSLRRRHPMAAMGYVCLVHKGIEDVPGARPLLVDILTRLRRPDEMFDATMLLVGDWNQEAQNPEVIGVSQPVESLNAPRFFTDMISAVLDRTPISEHKNARELRDGTPASDLPDESDADVESDPE